MSRRNPDLPRNPSSAAEEMERPGSSQSDKMEIDPAESESAQGRILPPHRPRETGRPLSSLSSSSSDSSTRTISTASPKRRRSSSESDDDDGSEFPELNDHLWYGSAEYIPRSRPDTPDFEIVEEEEEVETEKVGEEEKAEEAKEENPEDKQGTSKDDERKSEEEESDNEEDMRIEGEEQEEDERDEERPLPLFDFEEIQKRVADDIYKERAGRTLKGFSTPEFQEIYKLPKELEADFLKLVGTADVYNIYRNRPVFIGKTEGEITDLPRDVIARVPSLRNSVLGYIGLLIHENTNCFFSKKENTNFSTNYTTIEEGTVILINDFKDIIRHTSSDQLPLDVLKWCCDLSSELSQNNSGRISTNNCRTPEHFLTLFTTCPPIKEMINLLDLAITKLLELNPEHCMSILFYSSRHGTHFNWIWLHIADTFPGKVVENIFTIGGRQFKAYVDTIRTKQRENAQPALINQLHQEYKIRFQSLSEVFNFLMRRNNIALKNTVAKMIAESLMSETTEAGCTDYNIVFYFKLVTISQDTLKFLVQQNLHLATPQNFFRGMRQILSLDKEMILQRISYQEFGAQMIRELDSQSQAAAFKALARLALDPTAADIKHYPNLKAVAPVIREGAFSAMCEIINILLVNVHANEPPRISDYDIVSCFAHGSDLQFIVETALINPNWAPHLIRYLHVVSMAYSINKAAEIACRFLLTCSEPSLLHVLCAFLSTVVTFYPGLMDIAYKEIFSIREMFLSENSVRNDLPAKRFQRNLAFITNITTVLEWDLKSDDGFLKNFEFYPKSQLGNLLCGILSIAISICDEELICRNFNNIHLIVTELNRLIKSIAPPISEQKNVIQHKNVILRIKYIYKISIQLAHLLEIVLLTVSKESPNALVSFETFRSHIIIFYQDYVNQLHLCGQGRKTGAAQLFFISFLANCLQNTKEIFGEELDLNSWRDPTIEQLKIEENDDTYSFLDALQSMDTHQKISRLAHSGVIGQGARRLAPAFITTDDQLIRGHVYLDAVRNICVTTSLFNDIVNTRQLALYLVEVVCQDSVAADMLFQDWELEKEIIGKYQIIQKVHKSWLLRGLLNIVTEVQPCLWLCLPILKAQLADILSSLLSTTSRTVKVSAHIIEMMDRWMVLARKGNIVPKKFEYFMDFIPHVTVHEAFLLFLEIWRYFHQRAITLNMVENAIEAEKGAKNKGVELLKDNYEGDLPICRRILQRHIIQLGYLYPFFAPSSKTIPS